MYSYIPKNPSVAIVGATGVVGNEMISLLTERKFPCSQIRLFASEQSLGETYDVCGKEVDVEVLAGADFSGIDLILGASSAELAKEYVPKATEQGAIVIDNSSQFRMEVNVPLIVPEVNIELLASKRPTIIANPNCSTIQLVPLLHVLEKIAGLERVIVSTYQSVSGAGRMALDELWEQTQSIYTQKEMTFNAFQHQIAFNCIPQIDTMLDNGYTKEEIKIINESRKILGLPNLLVTATAVRVPVFHAHAESVTVDLKNSVEPKKVAEAFAAVPGITVMSDIQDYPLQINVSGKDDIHVGRIRQDLSNPKGITFWVVADNIRKGAALNAVQIAEYLLTKD